MTIVATVKPPRVARGVAPAVQRWLRGEVTSSSVGVSLSGCRRLAEM